jgi:hypothetical protein
MRRPGQQFFWHQRRLRNLNNGLRDSHAHGDLLVLPGKSRFPEAQGKQLCNLHASQYRDLIQGLRAVRQAMAGVPVKSVPAGWRNPVLRINQKEIRMTYKVLFPTPTIPGIANCRYPREQADALAAHIKAGIGNRRKFKLSRSEPPAGSLPMRKPYRWGWAVETDSKATAALVVILFPESIQEPV